MTLNASLGLNGLKTYSVLCFDLSSGFFCKKKKITFLFSVVILEGKEAGKCLLRLQDLPGTFLMDSLSALPANPNLTFVIEVRNKNVAD